MTTQTAAVEITKTAVKAAPKAAPKKAATEAKAPAKAAVKAVTKPAKAKAATKAKAPKKGATVKFVMVNRPASGGHLLAYTQAVLTLTGLDQGAAVPKAQLRKIMGDTAIRYHIDKGTLSQAEGSISVTDAGAFSFGDRLAKIDQSLVDAYMEVMTKGEPVESVCKNKANILALA